MGQSDAIPIKALGSRRRGWRCLKDCCVSSGEDEDPLPAPGGGGERREEVPGNSNFSSTHRKRRGSEGILQGQWDQRYENCALCCSAVCSIRGIQEGNNFSPSLPLPHPPPPPPHTHTSC